MATRKAIVLLTCTKRWHVTVYSDIGNHSSLQQIKTIQSPNITSLVFLKLLSQFKKSTIMLYDML